MTDGRPETAQSEIEAKQQFQKGVVDRKQGDTLIIELENGTEMQWPAHLSPDDIKEGDSVRLILATSKDDEAERQQIAKTLLNEILSSHTKS